MHFYCKMYIFLFILVMMGDLTHGQECTLLNKDMYYDQDWQITDCPCFHHDTENYSCPVQTSPKARLENPLVPCNFLPREFLTCDEPYDHQV